MNTEITKLLVALFVLFFIFALIIFSASKIYGKRQVTGNLWQVFVIEFLIIAGVLLPVLISGLFLMLALLGFNYRAHRELADMDNIEIINPAMIASFLISSAIICITGIANDTAISMYIPVIIPVISLVTTVVLYFCGAVKYIPMVWMLFITTLSAVCLLKIHDMTHGLFLVIFIFAITETNDSLAYVAGKLFGRKKILPSISPGKTVEGSLSGIVLALITGLVYNHLFLGNTLIFAILISLAMIVSGLCGDVLFSVYKRRHARKDFMPVLASQGGILDIYDSFLFASIVYYFIQPGYM